MVCQNKCCSSLDVVILLLGDCCCGSMLHTEQRQCLATDSLPAMSCELNERRRNVRKYLFTCRLIDMTSVARVSARGLLVHAVAPW